MQSHLCPHPDALPLHPPRIRNKRRGNGPASLVARTPFWANPQAEAERPAQPRQPQLARRRVDEIAGILVAGC